MVRKPWVNFLIFLYFLDGIFIGYILPRKKRLGTWFFKLLLVFISLSESFKWRCSYEHIQWVLSWSSQCSWNIVFAATGWIWRSQHPKVQVQTWKLEWHLLGVAGLCLGQVLKSRPTYIYPVGFVSIISLWKFSLCYATWTMTIRKTPVRFLKFTLANFYNRTTHAYVKTQALVGSGLNLWDTSLPSRGNPEV